MHSVPWAERLMRRIGERVAMCLPRFIEAGLGGSPGADGGGTPPPAPLEANPFVAARNEFTNAFGDLAKGKPNWQVIAHALPGPPSPLPIPHLPPLAPAPSLPSR